MVKNYQELEQLSYLGNIEIIYSKRKTLALQINVNGKILIRAPYGMPKSLIENFVSKKTNWLQRKQKEIANRNEKYSKPTFDEGTEFYYLGNKYKIFFDKEQKEKITFDDKIIIGKDWHNFPKLALVKWYKEQAKIYFEQRLLYQSNRLKINYKKLRISNARSSWGTCSSDNIISLSWRLIMAEAKIIDYVIIHELCHVKHKNHSQAFWSLVKLSMPEYKIYQQKLKAIGLSFHIDK